MPARAELLTSFITALTPVGLLDRFQLSGVIVRWWDTNQYNLRTLVTHGFDGVVDGWMVTIETALGGETPYGLPLPRRLIPDHLEEISQVDAERASLEATIREATRAADDDGDTAFDESDDAMGAAEIKKLKARLAAVKKRQKEVATAFHATLAHARGKLTPEQEQDLVLSIWQEGLRAHLHGYVTFHRRQVVAALETWWDKYAVSLADIESQRDTAAARMAAKLKELGYE
jgi:type I restriction enzyme M protein